MIVEISHSGTSNVLVNNSPLPIKVEVQLFRDGKSAYQIAIENGYVGTEAQWVATLIKVTNYTHNQVNPSNSWAVNHNMQYRPNLTCYDTAGTEIRGEILHTDNNNLQINFSAITGGIGYLS